MEQQLKIFMSLGGKMKVGDKIRILKDELHCAEVKYGDILEIIIVDYKNNNITVNHKKGNWDFSIFSLGKGFELLKTVNESSGPEDTKPELPSDTATGTKSDTGKPRLSLIPKSALWGMAKAFTYGEKKYGTHNFRKGISYSRLADATMRHLTAYMEGEDNDDESGNPHLDHALASLAMLKFMSVHRQGMDDRWLDPLKVDK